MLTLLANSVILRGFLGCDAEVPPSDGITEAAYAVLMLATVSGTWDLATNQWTPRTDWHRIVCPGPFFCGFTRGMRRGDYLEIEGELRALEQERGVVVAGERFQVSRTTYAVHATRIQRLERPDALVDLARTASADSPYVAGRLMPLRSSSENEIGCAAAQDCDGIELKVTRKYSLQSRSDFGRGPASRPKAAYLPRQCARQAHLPEEFPSLPVLAGLYELVSQ